MLIKFRRKLVLYLMKLLIKFRRKKSFFFFEKEFDIYDESDCSKIVTYV